MHELTQFLLRYGYSVVFAFVLAEQSGLPIPAVPVLLVMGALTAQGKFSFLLTLGLAIVATLIGDSIWYVLGRVRGASILNLLCRISLEPDSCVSGAKNLLVRWGAPGLLIAKFVPGLGTIAPAMAGWSRLPLWRILTADTGGALLWAGAYLGAGVVFSPELETVAAILSRLGGWMIAFVAGLLAAWIGWKYYQRRKFIRELRVARVKPEELLRMIQDGEPVIVVDLRFALDLANDPARVPGAIWIDSEQIDARFADIPPDREVILYCT